MSWCVLVEYVKDSYYARSHNPNYYTTRYIMNNDIFLLCHQLASTTHVTELFTGQ